MRNQASYESKITMVEIAELLRAKLERTYDVTINPNALDISYHSRTKTFTVKVDVEWEVTLSDVPDDVPDEGWYYLTDRLPSVDEEIEIESANNNLLTAHVLYVDSEDECRPLKLDMDPDGEHDSYGYWWSSTGAGEDEETILRWRKVQS